MPTSAPIKMLSTNNKIEKNEESQKIDDLTHGDKVEKEKVSQPEALPILDNKQKPEKKTEEEEENLSYQELAMRRKQKHMSFLQILDFKSMNDKVSSFLPPTPSPKRQRLTTPRRLTKNKEQVPSRKSLRLQNKPASENIVNYSSNTQPEPTPKKKKIRGVVSFAVASRETGDQLPETFVKDLQFLKDKMPETNLQPQSLTNYVEKFGKMKIQDSLVAKLAYSRIYCVAAHPSSEKIIFATGSRDGEVSFWDLESRNERLPFLFVPHSERVSCLNFSPYNLSELYTSSYDGSMRCGNLVEGVFNEVFHADADDDRDILCTSFDFLSSSTFVVSLWHGFVTLIDKRTKNIQGERSFKVFDCVAKTVSIHPTNKDYFVVAGGNGIASIWDLRNSKKPVNELNHQRSLNSAYFSPITGNYILTTSMDDRLSVFESPTLTAEIKLHRAIRHNNHTGRWLAPLRAVWLPNCEDGFLVGSMEQPRRIEVFGIDGKIAHIFSGDSLGSVCSVNAVHPSRPALAGANSSGKLHVFLSAESK